MPKHRPTNEDMEKVKPCPICSGDVFDEDMETCCWECEQVMEIFRKDVEEDFYNEELQRFSLFLQDM